MTGEASADVDAQALEDVLEGLELRGRELNKELAIIKAECAELAASLQAETERLQAKATKIANYKQELWILQRRCEGNGRWRKQLAQEAESWGQRLRALRVKQTTASSELRSMQVSVDRMDSKISFAHRKSDAKS